MRLDLLLGSISFRTPLDLLLNGGFEITVRSTSHWVLIYHANI